MYTTFIFIKTIIITIIIIIIITINSCANFILEKLVVVQLVKKFPALYGTVGSLPFLQEITTGPESVPTLTRIIIIIAITTTATMRMIDPMNPWLNNPKS
jgi:hypothetical protein